jgi:uncharacterized protein YjdB
VCDPNDEHFEEFEHWSTRHKLAHFHRMLHKKLHPGTLLIFGAPYPQEGPVPVGGIHLMATQITDAQNVPVTAAFLDAKGNPTSVASTTWTSSDPSIASVVPDASNPLAATVDSGPAGSALGTVTLTCTSDDGSVASGDLEVVAGPASQGGVTFGTPVAQ